MRTGTPRRHLPRDLRGRGEQLSRLDRRERAEAQCVGALRRQARAGEHHVRRHRGTHHPWKPLRPAVAGYEAEAGLRQAEGRPGGQDGECGGQDELETPAERYPVHGGDHGHRVVLDLGQDPLSGTEHSMRLLRVESRQLIEIGARAEGPLPRSGDDDRAYSSARAQRLDRVRDAPQGPRVERVVDVRAVDRHDGNRVVLFDNDLFVSHGFAPLLLLRSGLELDGSRPR